MATWQAWSESITIGSLVTKAVVDQIRNNLDYLQENTVCVTHDTTYQSAYDTGQDATHYGTDNSSYDTTYQSAYDTGQDATHYGTDNSSYDTTYNNALLVTDHSSQYGTDNSSYDTAYESSHKEGFDSTHQDVHYEGHCSSVLTFQ